MLAEAARLRALVAEHRRDVGELDRLRQIGHPVLQVGAADRRGALRAQRQAVAAAILEDVHLLLDDVRRFAHAARVEVGALEGGRLDKAVAAELRLLARRGDDSVAHAVLGGQQVARAARRLEHGFVLFERVELPGGDRAIHRTAVVRLGSPPLPVASPPQGGRN